MDLERIKQNLRLRSGRTKKSRKSSKAPTQATSATTSASDNHPPPDLSQPNEAEKATLPIEPNGEGGGEKEKPASTEDNKEEPPVRTSSPDTTPVADEVGTHPDQQKPEIEEDQTDNHSESLKTPSLVKASSPSHSQVPTDSDMDKTQELRHASSSEAMDFDLMPSTPVPKAQTRSKPLSVEALSELLFSSGHLNTLLRMGPQLTRFTAFLQRYRPSDYPLIVRFLEMQKAVKAIEYANAVAQGITVDQKDENPLTLQAAELNKSFEEQCDLCFKALVGSALPMYITFSLVQVVSAHLINEITGRQEPGTEGMVEGVSEVFCLTDPAQEDNPIIYASEEFYRLTGYDRDDVIGYNCRFLQGAKTNLESVKRLRDAIRDGKEIYETLLNYRRNGKPFINILMIAPLHDNRGKVKYHLGAQIDVTRLVENGTVLEAFQRYVVKYNMERRRDAATRNSARDGSDRAQTKKRALAKLRELSETFDLEESAVVQVNSRSSSLTRDDDDRSLRSQAQPKTPRRVYADSDLSDTEEDEATEEEGKNWDLGSSGQGRLSGKLPGIYESFMLVRPMPSLRIVFVSPRLRAMGDVTQSPFLSHVAAPAGTLAGLKESFDAGVPVSAKIHFTATRGENRQGTRIKSGTRHEDGKHGRACWISCTPMLDGSERVGVWMVVIVEKSAVRSQRTQRSSASSPSEVRPGGTRRENGVREDESPKSQAREGRRDEDFPLDEKLGTPTKAVPNHVDGVSERGRSSESGSKRYAENSTPQVAETPVEEYQQPQANQTQSHASYSVQVPTDTPPIQQEADDSQDEFVNPRSSVSESPKTQRVLIDSDSSSEHESPVASRFFASDTHLPSRMHSSPPVSPEEIPPSPPSDAQSPDTSPGTVSQRGDASSPSDQRTDSKSDDEVQEADHYDEERHGREELGQVANHEDSPDEQDRPDLASHSHGPSGMVLDYLRHPGSRRNRDSHGVMSNRWHDPIQGDEYDDYDEKGTDVDCARSPYSVD